MKWIPETPANEVAQHIPSQYRIGDVRTDDVDPNHRSRLCGVHSKVRCANRSPALGAAGPGHSMGSAAVSVLDPRGSSRSCRVAGIRRQDDGLYITTGAGAATTRLFATLKGKSLKEDA